MEYNIFLISAVRKLWINNLLDKIINILSNSSDIINKWLYYNLWKINIKSNNEKRYIQDITEDKLSYLIENWYIEEKNSEYIKVRKVMDPFLVYLVYVLPWGNDEAEMRFWQELEKKWILKRLESNWVRPWDILEIPNIYNNKWEPRYIMYVNY